MLERIGPDSIPTPEPTPEPPPPNPADLAWAYLGVPYVWGGSTPAGFDCSGLTQWVWAEAGRWLPRTTRQQWAATTPVDEPAYGDLVFFAGTNGPGITHVGVYIGGGQMIHAPDAGQVVTVSDVWSSYWAAHFAGFRR